MMTKRRKITKVVRIKGKVRRVPVEVYNKIKRINKLAKQRKEALFKNV
jgi:hypothetical protein